MENGKVGNCISSIESQPLSQSPLDPFSRQSHIGQRRYPAEYIFHLFFNTIRSINHCKGVAFRKKLLTPIVISIRLLLSPKHNTFPEYDSNRPGSSRDISDGILPLQKSNAAVLSLQPAFHRPFSLPGHTPP